MDFFSLSLSVLIENYPTSWYNIFSSIKTFRFGVVFNVSPLHTDFYDFLRES